MSAALAFRTSYRNQSSQSLAGRPEEWEWLSRRLVETLHAETLSRFGGTEDLLESTLAGPRRLALCKDLSLWDLTPAYWEGLLQNHPFADGNKRVGLIAARSFLFKNGYRLRPVEAEMVAVIHRWGPERGAEVSWPSGSKRTPSPSGTRKSDIPARVENPKDPSGHSAL